MSMNESTNISIETSNDVNQEENPRIDNMTIARLLTTVSFRRKDTQLSQKTLDGLSEYIRLFTCEAIVRANEDRVRESKDVRKAVSLPPMAVKPPKSNIVDDDSENRIGDEEEGEADILDNLDREESGRVLADEVLDTRHLEHIVGLLVLDF